MGEGVIITAAVIAVYDVTRALYASGASPRGRERDRDEARVPIPNVGGVGVPFMWDSTCALSSAPIVVLILIKINLTTRWLIT